MKTTHRILAHFMLAGSLALALPADAQPNLDGAPRCGGPNRPTGMARMPEEKPLPFLMHGLNLSDEQRDKIFSLMHAQAPAMRDQAKAVHKTQMELRRLGMSGEYSEAKAKTLAEENAQAMAKMALMHARTAAQIYLILTPEQRKQVEERKPRQPQIDLP